MKKNSFFFIFYMLFLIFYTSFNSYADEKAGIELCNQFKILFLKNGIYCSENYIIPSEGENFPYNIKIDISGHNVQASENDAEKKITELYFVFSMEEAVKNHTLIEKIISSVKNSSITDCNVHFLFSYGDTIKDFKETTISGTESFIESLDDTDNIAAICINFNKPRNSITPGSAKGVSPAWMIQLAADAFHTNRLFYVIKGGILTPFYRLGILKEDFRTGLFLNAEIPAVGIDLAVNEKYTFDYEKKILNFFSTIITDFDSEKTAEWDRHSQIIQLGTFVFLIPEIFTVTCMIILAFVSLLILCEFSFIFHSSNKNLSKLVLKSWYLIPICVVLTAAAFSFGQLFSWIISRFTEIDPYFLISLKVAIGIAVISFSYLLMLRVKGNNYHYVYPYLMTISSVLNIFIFSAVDMSLFYLFAWEYVLVYLSRLMKRTVSLAMAFIILTIPFIPYFAQIVVYAQQSSIYRITFCTPQENLLISFALLPFEFSWLRILSRLNSMWKKVEKKRRKFIKQNIIAITSSVAIFAVILMVTSKIIPQKYRQESQEPVKEFFTTHNDDIIKIEYADNVYFGNINRKLHIQLAKKPENVKITLIGKTASPLQYSEFPYTSDSRYYADFIKLPVYPPEDFYIPFIANRSTDMYVLVQATYDSDSKENTTLEVIKTVEIKKMDTLRQ